MGLIRSALHATDDDVFTAMTIGAFKAGRVLQRLGIGVIPGRPRVHRLGLHAKHLHPRGLRRRIYKARFAVRRQWRRVTGPSYNTALASINRHPYSLNRVGQRPRRSFW